MTTKTCKFNSNVRIVSRKQPSWPDFYFETTIDSNNWTDHKLTTERGQTIQTMKNEKWECCMRNNWNMNWSSRKGTFYFAYYWIFFFGKSNLKCIKCNVANDSECYRYARKICLKKMKKNERNRKAFYLFLVNYHKAEEEKKTSENNTRSHFTAKVNNNYWHFDLLDLSVASVNYKENKMISHYDWPWPVRFTPPAHIFHVNAPKKNEISKAFRRKPNFSR